MFEGHTRDLLQLQLCFAKDSRFKDVSVVAGGGYGCTYRVKYEDSTRPDLKSFLIKRAHTYEKAREALIVEKEYISKMRGGMHIVQVVDILNNPLEIHDFQDPWLALEWLPNGTLNQFIWHAREQNLGHLPNRLLWKFFLCLFRGLCGMAWPRNRQDNLVETEQPVPGVPPGNLQHNDLHRGNVMIGEFEPNGEHGTTPVLKIIDFGRSEELVIAPGDTTAVQLNLYDIGKLMVMLITLDPTVKCNPLRPARVDYLGEFILTQANEIIRPRDPTKPYLYPWLDEWLTTIIALCMATDNDNRPTLQAMNTWLPYAVVNRHEGFYNDPQESDTRVSEVCHMCIFNPPHV
ncbi:kinase-like domain-containing protein [Jackrogersella minutella]|nr:kinase-like domain-containing protein [Jackrogersella minutella]